MKNLFVLAVALAVASAGVTKDDHEVNGGVEVDGAICKGREIGDYQHPTMCTKFIACASGGRAFEMPCATCHVDATTCPEGVLHFSEEHQQCLEADRAGCGGGKPTTTTTRAPTPQPPPRPWPQPGDPCDPDDCKLEGWCHEYYWCERVKDVDGHKGTGKDGYIKYGDCKEAHNLYFNPDVNPTHGGVCDFFGNLRWAMKKAYNNDPECIDPHCEWKRDPNNRWCANTYQYFHPDRNDGERVILTCPAGLLWSQADKNCLDCSDVYDKNGDCCCPDE